MTLLAPEFPLLADSVNVLQEEIKKCLNDAEYKIVIGFKNVPYVDSASLEALIDAQETLQKKGGELKIIHPNAVCKDALIATRLTERFGVFSEIESAGESFI